AGGGRGRPAQEPGAERRPRREEPRGTGAPARGAPGEEGTAAAPHRRGAASAAAARVEGLRAPPAVVPRRAGRRGAAAGGDRAVRRLVAVLRGLGGDRHVPADLRQPRGGRGGRGARPPP